MSPFADLLKENDDSLMDSFTVAKRAGNADDVEIIMRASRQNVDGLNMSLIDTAIKIIRHPYVRHDAKTFKIAGYSQEKQDTVELDLLSDKLVVKKSIVRADRRSRAVSKTSAYNAIISAYNEIRQDIAEAVSIKI
jgi:hypothetical protein